MFYSFDHILQAFFATLFTWGMTAAGATCVLFFKEVNKKAVCAMLGFSAGVMTAASLWSLLIPAARMCVSLETSPYFMPALGFGCGAILLFIADCVFSYISRNKNQKRASLLIFSITLHNIPEGLCIGVAFGSLKYGLDGATLASACLLALGIGVQNFPEGAAVSIPLIGNGASRKRAFLWGQLSGAVEPISAVIGAILVLYVRAMLPFCLSFAAGAMIYVVIAELIPECKTHKSFGAVFAAIGFAVMTLLDITLG